MVLQATKSASLKSQPTWLTNYQHCVMRKVRTRCFMDGVGGPPANAGQQCAQHTVAGTKYGNN